jgi:adenine-specific DNA-methyltransferase
MHSPDLTQHNIDRIAELFPTVVTESQGADGNVVRAVDFDLLRQELSDHVVEGPQERYQLDWPGKREALFASNAPIAKTLRPVRKESVNFDATQNIFIEGDNLDALKLLQESYLGKVKLIYIDPPYNTGNDFIYNDKFAQTSGDYLAQSGQVNDAGARLLANVESNGRFHSDWLSMMYPRLKLARNLLTPDGAIFMSIGSDEASNLRKLADEVFGEANFVAAIAWQNLDTIKNDARYFSGNHEHVLCYARNIDSLRIQGRKKGDKQVAYYKNPDGDPRGPYLLTPLHAKSGSEAGIYSFTFSNGQTWQPPTGTFPRFSRDTLSRLDREGRLYLDPRGEKVPQRKTYLAEVGDRMPPTTFWSYQEFGSTRQSNREIAEILGKGMFQNPKPTKLVHSLLDLVEGADNAIVLDFFAGSGTTAHAVMMQNAEDGGNRRFILAQLDELTDAHSDARKAGYGTIADLSRERIRRSAARVVSDAQVVSGQLDLGFRVLKVDTTSMVDVLRSPDVLKQEGLDLFTDSVKPDRTSEDLLFQVLLDWGLELSMPIAAEQIDGHEVFVVEDGALIACFGSGISAALIREIASREPLRAVFRDSGFVTDADRINAEQIFAEVSPATDLKAI